MGTITLTTTRSGSGPTATIKITTTDSTGLSFVAGPVSATSASELAGIKQAVLDEITRQMLSQ